ncbi:MAG: hypothetical protein NVSMB39_7170 [Candidatus Saccharimonadales bacterium]
MKQPPNTPLAKALEEAAAIKREMLDLLIELETNATGQKPDRPGAWRHHPVEWAEQNPPKDLT